MFEPIPIALLTVFLASIPFLLVLLTSYARISIVLTFLKQALSTSVPSSQIIIALSLILTGYIMQPVIKEVQKEAVTPYLKGEWGEEKTPEIAKNFFDKAWPPLRTFMLYNTREKDVELFLDMGGAGSEKQDVASLPWYIVIPSFVLSELRCAFLLGFLLFLPFLVIDMVVSSLLMSMGMVMLPPVMISFPFKILLFVLIDGWRLVVQQMVQGYH